MRQSLLKIFLIQKDSLGMGIINSSVKQAFVCSFQQKCIKLVCQAHDILCNNHTINQEMDEETVSTCIADIIDNSQQAIEWMIHIGTEHRLTTGFYIQNPISSKSLNRIDFRYETDVWENNNPNRLRYYMEAKNLYQKDFSKTSNNSVTSAKAYFNRYIETGIDHIVTGYYPSNTLLLGYVLVGDVCPVVDGINSQLDSLNRNGEHLTHFPSCYESNMRRTFSSEHNGLDIKHLMLKFT